MKRLLPALCAAILLSTLGQASAQAGWWHRHSGPGPAGVGANKKDKQTKAHREKRTHEKVQALYNFPKSVGWFHKGPGPAGAGSGQESKNQAAQQQSARRSSSHKSFLWWRHHESMPQPATSAGR
jgi:hypothetical protein